MSDTPSKSFFTEARDFLKDLIIIVAVVMVVRTFFVMPFQINGQSMYDSYYDKEFIIVDRFSYQDLPVFGRVREPRRWDVVVFKPWVSQDRKYFIKRVIGLPGETLKIQWGKVFLKEDSSDDFIEIDETPYLSEANQGRTYVRNDQWEYIYDIPEGEYFVMGDNRQASTDSRTCFSTCSIRENYIDMTMVTGRVLVDLGYFNIKEFSFTHPTVTEDGAPLSTTPRFLSSPGTHNYSN